MATSSYGNTNVNDEVIRKSVLETELSALPHKYSEAAASLTSGVPYTVTHYLGTELIQITLWDLSTGEMVTGFTADNRMPNEVDITVSVTGNYDIVIIG